MQNKILETEMERDGRLYNESMSSLIEQLRSTEQALRITLADRDRKLNRIRQIIIEPCEDKLERLEKITAVVSEKGEN